MREYTFPQAITAALCEEMRRDPTTYIIGEDVGAMGGIFGATPGLLEEFGENRVIDSPISEAAILGTSVGAALMGMRPIPEVMFCDWLTVGFDQLVNQAPKLNYMSGGKVGGVPITIRTTCGGGIRAAAQHSQSNEAWYINCPGLKVVYPATPYDLYGLLKSSIRDDNPVLFLEHKLLYFLPIKNELPDEEFTIPLGKAEVKRAGEDVSIITYGLMVHKALAAAETLSAEGVRAEVVDLRTLSPLDRDAIRDSVTKTGRAVVVHEAPKTGGFGGELVAVIVEEAFDYLNAPVIRVAAPDAHSPFSPPLEDAFMPNEADIVAAVQKVIE
jgi:pyruvate/2-oxoglutarate/acetoin dehydrogenase E1 component